MGCCKGETKEDVGIHTIKEGRWPTDIIPLLMFLVMWGMVIMLWQLAVTSGGTPYKILYGVDMYGKVCGIDHPDQPLAAWPHPFYYEPKICVSSCDYTSDIVKSDESSRMAVLYTSTPFAGYCIPKLAENFSLSVEMNVDSQFSEGLSNAGAVVSRNLRDIHETYTVILTSSLTCIFWVFACILLIRMLAGYIVGLLCAAVVVLFTYGGYMIFSFASSETAAQYLDEDGILAVQIFGGICCAIGVILCLVLFFMRKSIQIAVEVVKEASKAIFDMPLIFAFPIWPAALGVAYFMFWIFTGLYVHSVSFLVPEPTPEAVTTYNAFSFPERAMMAKAFPTVVNMTNENPAEMQRFTHDKNWEYAQAFHFFHMLWNVQFLIYFGYLVFAGATCDWYFTKERDAKGNKKRGSGEGQLTNWPVVKSFWRTLKAHLGTVAITSLIIAIIQFCRYLITYLEKQTTGDPPNRLQKALFACLKCCLRCAECCMDKINRNALIWTAIWGDGFCTSCCSSFALIWRNLHRVAAISAVSTILLNITVFLICLFNSATAWSIIQFGSAQAGWAVSSPTAPCIVVFLLSFMIARLFIEVFQAVIDTIFFCFLVDSETNDSGQMLASVTLQKLVGKYKKESEKAAEEERGREKKRPGEHTRKVIPNTSDDTADTQ